MTTAARPAMLSATMLMAGAITAAHAEEVSYKLDVFPILQARCAECHKPEGIGYEKSGLDLSTYAGLMRGTSFGPIVIPGSPLTSNLNVLIEGRAAKSIQMPHNQRPLLKCQQQIVNKWVEQGAKDN
jgi:hypothetical protein